MAKRFSGTAFALIFTLLLLLSPEPAAQDVAINEIMASNASVIADEDGDFGDWIELFNYGEDSVNLEGFGLSDNYGDPFKWVFPDVSIEPNGFMIIWASGKDRRPVGGWTNGLMREVFTGIPGSTIDDLVNHPDYPDNPEHRHLIRDGFEAPVNVDDHYGQKVHGYIEPPVTGDYVFWIASDDNGRLYLSSDEDHANITGIASVPGWTQSREWDKYPEQQSVPVPLVEGRKYYIKALMKEHAGGDNLAVRWMLPSGVIQEPVPAEHLYWRETELHTNFRINREGEEVILTAPDSSLVDEVPPTEQLTNVSYGRYPDGTGGFYYFPAATPGSPNTGNRLVELPVIPDPPVFSHRGGTYSPEFTLSFDHDADMEVYYTTDGSHPLPGISPLYTEPVPVSGTMIVRAVTHIPGSVSSEPAGELYTKLSDDIKDFSSNLPVVVLHQFDRQITPGGRTPAYISVFDTIVGGRTGLISDPALQGRVMINIRGSSSQGFPKKMFGFHLTEEDGSNRKEEILGMPEEHNWILNGPYSDKSLMRNVYAYGLSNDIGRYSPRTRFVELFMHSGSGDLRDAHYHGVYVLVERIKWAEGRVDINKIGPDDNEEPEISGGYMIKKDRFNPGESGLMTARGTNLAFVRPSEEDITPQQKAWLENYLTEFETALFSENFADPKSGYNKYIEPGSFIDAHLITELLKEIDGYRLSTFMYKDRNDKLVMGPLWDFNLSLGNANYLQGWRPTGWYYQLISEEQYLNGWYTRLFRDPRFRAEYRERWWQLRRGQFSDEALTARIDHNAAILDEAQERNYKRWPVLDTYIWPNWFIAETFEEEIGWMTKWLIERAAWIDGQMGDPTLPVHFWHFNDLPSGDITEAKADYSALSANYPAAEDHPAAKADTPVTAATIKYTGSGSMDRVNDGTLLNADFGDAAGRALRVRNPSNEAELLLSLPTTGYRNVVLRYMAKRTPNGARKQTVWYRTGENDEWIAIGDTLEITETYRQFRFDFAGIEGSNDNPGFAARILFHGEEASGTSGNNRFDNFTLEGYSIVFYSKPGGDLTDLASWGTQPDGTGEPPASFDMNSALFHIRNRTSAEVDTDWQVGGEGSGVVVGDGQNSIRVTVNGVLDAVVDVTANATLELANAALPILNTLEDGSAVILAGNAPTIPFNSYYDLVVEDIDPDFTEAGEIEVRGDLTLRGQVRMPDARGNREYDLRFTGPHDQLITGNGNVIRGYNIIFDKPAGRVGFSPANGGAILASDNQLILIMGPDALFEDDGIDIYAGNSVNIAGDPSSYNFTGTLILAGTEDGIVKGAGAGNNFNIRDSGSNNSNAAAALNNLVVRVANRDGEFRFRDGGGDRFTVRGDLTVEAGAAGRIRFYGNEVAVAGDLIIEEGFEGSIDRIDRLHFEGSDQQIMSVPGTIDVGDLRVDNEQGLVLGGRIRVENNLHLESGIIRVREGSLPALGTEASVSGYGSRSYIDGPLGIYKDNTAAREAVFPVGDGGLYNPLTIRTSHGNSNEVLYIVSLSGSSPPGYTLPETILKIYGGFYYTLDILGDYHIDDAYVSIPYGPGMAENDESLLRILISENGGWQNLGGEANEGVVRSTVPFTEPGILALAERAPEATVTSSAGRGGTIGPEGTLTIEPGTDIIYEIRAGDGYHISNIMVNGNPVPGAPGHFLFYHTIGHKPGNNTIRAEFEQNNYTDIRIYPNPANDILRVEFMQNIEHVAVISIYSTSGKKVIERTLAPGDNRSGWIGVGGLDPGLYLLKIQYDRFRFSGRVAIIR
ncbi:MAG: T9SS C-terminal target domain-containing protein [Marinilabiliales bacterium]|nr:MAG: T9SS C-terminal target domain-containing protein [Marinilabiliales bacterium]